MVDSNTADSHLPTSKQGRGGVASPPPADSGSRIRPSEGRSNGQLVQDCSLRIFLDHLNLSPLHELSHRLDFMMAEAKSLVPDWEIYCIVDYGIGLSYRSTRLDRLADRFHNPMPQSTTYVSPSQGLRIWPQFLPEMYKTNDDNRMHLFQISEHRRSGSFGEENQLEIKVLILQ